MAKSLRSCSNPNKTANNRITAGNIEIAKALKEKRTPLVGLGYWGAKSYFTKTSTHKT